MTVRFQMRQLFIRKLRRSIRKQMAVIQSARRGRKKVIPQEKFKIVPWRCCLNRTPEPMTSNISIIETKVTPRSDNYIIYRIEHRERGMLQRRNHFSTIVHFYRNKKHQTSQKTKGLYIVSPWKGIMTDAGDGDGGNQTHKIISKYMSANVTLSK